jgi:hypothetical protein
MVKREKIPDLPPKTVEAYLKAVKATLGAEIKEGFGAPYTAINGNMYSMLAKRTGELGIRLSKEDLAEFMAKYKKRFNAGPWPPPREYAGVPASLLYNTKALSGWLKKSLAYAKTLKPKTAKDAPAKTTPTKKATSAKKPAAKKPAGKKPAAKKKPAATKATAKKPAARKTATKKPTAKKPAAKKKTTRK